MAESMETFPTEIWIHIVSKAGLKKPTLASISLVSRSLRDVAQRQLFRDVTFHYQSSLGLQGTHIDWNPFQQKVFTICRSPRLRSFIQSLRILFCNDAPWELPHTRASDTVFCKMMEFVAASLPSMIILRRISYNAPFLLEDLHRAILLHPHLKGVVITPTTFCKTPCSEATVRRGPRHALKELEIADWSPTEIIQGLTSPLAGPRRCALTSNILITHSLSLRKLKVPLLLLYDAIVATSTLPEFPHLESLSVGFLSPMIDLAFPDLLGDCVERFLLHVHETIRHLDWRPYIPYIPFQKFPASTFPLLETLEGAGIECLLGLRPLRRLRLIAQRGTTIDERLNGEKESIQALRRCLLSSPQLKALCIEGFILSIFSMDWPPVISAFSSLEELFCGLRMKLGRNLPALANMFTPQQIFLEALRAFLKECVLNLPLLHTLSVHVQDTDFYRRTALSDIILLASSIQSKSLERFNYRLAVYTPEASPLDKKVFESVNLYRVRDGGEGEPQWTAPQGVVIGADEFPCEVHNHCILNRNSIADILLTKQTEHSQHQDERIAVKVSNGNLDSHRITSMSRQDYSGFPFPRFKSAAQCRPTQTFPRCHSPLSILKVDWKTYRDKVVGICSSPYLCSVIQQLQIIFCNTAPLEMPHSDFTDRVFCEMMDKVAFALPTMIILRRMSYFAPVLLGNLHRAILLHPHLKRISITPFTCCKKPCAEASVHRDCHQSLQELDIPEWSPIQPIHGLTSPSMGARRCSLTSNILVTHSLSLRKLRVPVLLLYDAIAAVPMLPEFPHLQSLAIMRFFPLPLEHLYDSMASHVVRFLLHVHGTIQQLDWRGYAPFNTFTKLPPSCFPNLETLEGEGVEPLLGNHSLQRLRLIASPGEISEEKQEEENHSIQVLRKCQMSSPQLTTLFIEQYILNIEHAPLIYAFSALEELSCAFRIYIGPDPPELVSLCLTPLEALISLVQRLLGNCIPNLCHLHTLSVYAYNTGFKEDMPLKSITKLASSLRSESLERFSFRLAVDEPDASPLDKEVYETVELHRVRNAEGSRSQWTSPLGKVITTDYIHCEVPEQCNMNRPMGHYEGWINI